MASYGILEHFVVECRLQIQVCHVLDSAVQLLNRRMFRLVDESSAGDPERGVRKLTPGIEHSGTGQLKKLE